MGQDGDRLTEPTIVMLLNGLIDGLISGLRRGNSGNSGGGDGVRIHHAIIHHLAQIGELGKNIGMTDAHQSNPVSNPALAPDSTSGQQHDRAYRLKRLRYQSGYRGTKELDAILGAFAAKYLDSMTDAELTAYEDLLEVPEVVLWQWLSGQGGIPAEEMTPMLQKILAFMPTVPTALARPPACP